MKFLAFYPMFLPLTTFNSSNYIYFALKKTPAVLFVFENQTAIKKNTADFN